MREDITYEVHWAMMQCGPPRNKQMDPSMRMVCAGSLVANTLPHLSGMYLPEDIKNNL